MAIKHAFTSEVEDGADETLVQPSDWNADHTGTNTHDHSDAASGGAVVAASDTKAGVIELAIATEVTTGKATDRAVTPDALAGSTIFGVKTAELTCFAPTETTVVGDGAAFLFIPPSCTGMNLVYVHARVITAGTTNTLDVQIANVTDSQDMLSTKLTIDSGEYGSDTAATPAVIDTTHDDVATNDLLRVDVDAVHTMAAKGLIVTLGFQLP